MNGRLAFALLVFAGLGIAWALGGLGERAAGELAAGPLPAPLEPPAWPAALAAEERRLVGRVTASDGSVRAEAAVVRRGSDRTVWAYTDAEGAFELSGLPPGALMLDVLAWPDPPARFEIEDGAERAELALPAPPAELPRARPIERAALAGVVRDASGAPVAGCEVALEPDFAGELAAAEAERAASALAEFAGQMPRRARTSDDGAFRFEGLALGRYRVAVLPEWARGGSWPDLADPAMRALEHRAPAAGESAELELGTCVGRIASRVADTAGRPLRGATLILRSSADRRRLWPPTATDDAGAFAFEDLPPGRYELEVLAGEAALTLAELAVAAGQTTAPEIAGLAVRAPQ